MNTPPQHQRPEATAPPESSFLKKFGPGLITGASDDDPSGIATYSQAGAAYGYSLLWTLLFSFPLMSAIQEICARIGRVTGRGIAGNIRRHYSGWLLYPVVLLLLLANTINLGADIGAMGAAMHLLVGGSPLLYAVGFAVLCLLLEVFISYRRYSSYLKWMTVVLFSYVATAFFVKLPWREVLLGSFLPTFSKNGNYWAIIIAILGTTISPYLFFWQASQETEEIRNHREEEPLRKEPWQARVQFGRIRFDTLLGMLFSNAVAFSIVLVAGATLHVHGITDIQTADQAAAALRPFAGRFATYLFAVGIIGTGLLAVPVLAGSAGYAIGEALQWRTGLDRKLSDAKGFYAVLAVATVAGLAINFPVVQAQLHVSPMKALFFCAVLNGVVAVPVLVVVMLLASSPKVMGRFALSSGWLRNVGWGATATMFLASLGMFFSWKP